MDHMNGSYDESLLKLQMSIEIRIQDPNNENRGEITFHIQCSYLHPIPPEIQLCSFVEGAQKRTGCRKANHVQRGGGVWVERSHFLDVPPQRTGVCVGRTPSKVGRQNDGFGFPPVQSLRGLRSVGRADCNGRAFINKLTKTLPLLLRPPLRSNLVLILSLSLPPPPHSALPHSLSRFPAIARFIPVEGRLPEKE
ncbi:hypothetical protein CDAR_293931 [Caerostris darwini]|uniref:Uncharacterized protein n=1 Tax=Caerostris darwini TaxID=1538125 RepID=A0AAV4VGC0_9ARAC|nr:hypothetical protein CDAR_293931 [Caerostris darwini]